MGKEDAKKKSSGQFPHSGHRQRVIKKYIEHGLDSFAEHEVLELLLFFSIPRIDTNEIAHSIINEYGSLKNVLEASPDELKAMSGVGDNSAALISLFRAVHEYINTSVTDKRIKFRDTSDLGAFCVNYFSKHVEESFIMLAMDSELNLKKVCRISKGTANETAFYSSKIVQKALNLHATTVVIAHNHPGGSTQPSTADLKLTLEIKKTMDGVRVDLLDHLICSNNFFTSLRERGLFDGAIVL